ncbi:MAG: hypothetical protein L0H31_07265 [Nocardioidaceae bacterium]|nr:hypothetical protein [Nocardioidaceae bacterium]
MALATVLSVAGCSSDTDNGDQPASGTSAVKTNARLGQVGGKLAKAKAAKVVSAVADIVEQWSEAAFEGSGSTQPKGAFGAFTGDARDLALKQTALSNQGAGKIGDARTTRRVVRVDVIAARGRAVGATARIKLLVQLPGLDRTDQIRGRLLLTPTKHGWKVFGFDVQRGEGTP